MRTFSLPDQTGHVGEFLQTNGENVLWAPGGGGSGVVVSIVAGTGIDVDSTDPANPIVSVDSTVPTGNGVAGQITFWSGVSTIDGDADFTWDNATKIFTVAGGGNTNLLIDPVAGIYAIGDYESAVGGTQIVVDDTSGIISLLPNGISTAGNSLLMTSQGASLMPRNAGSGAILRWYEGFTGGTNFTALQSPATRATDITYTFPSSDPVTGQVLSATAPVAGISTLSWTTPTTGTIDGSGTATQVAYFTDADTIASSANFAWDNVNAQLLLGNGSVTNPAYSFVGLTGMGLYRSGNTMRYARDGIERIRFGTDGRISVNANATGIATANGIFHGTYDADTQDQDGIITIDTYSDEGWTTTIGGRRARGTALAPTQVMAGDKLVEFIGKGWHGGADPDFAPSNRALMGFYANQDWDDETMNGTYVTINTTTDNTAANHPSVLIDDEGNVAVSTANSSTTTSSFPSAWSSTSAKHMVIRSGGANRDIGLFMQTSDNSAGMEMWYDGSTGKFSFDSMADSAGSTMVFNFRTLGTTVPVLTLDATGLSTFSGGAKLAAGTTTLAPLTFQAGTNLTSALAGVFEFDGKAFYSTPVNSARGISPSVQFSILSSDFTLANASGVQSAFGTSQDVFTLAASTSYFFEGMYMLSTGTTSHSLGMAFALGGGASVTSIHYVATAWKGAANTTATAQGTTRIDRVASTVVLAASAATDGAVYFSGVIRMNAGGTVTPQIAFSADPTGTCLMLTDSYIRFYPIGDNTVTKVGNVA